MSDLQVYITRYLWTKDDMPIYNNLKVIKIFKQFVAIARQ